MRLVYTVRAAHPTEHLGDFELDLEGVDGPTVDLVLPSWIPGSYHIVSYAREVRALRAFDRRDDSELPVDRIDKARWRVTTHGSPHIRATYTVYGHQMITEGFDLTPEHLFLNAGLCLPYVDGHQTVPVEVQLEVPSDWTVVTELEGLGLEPPRYRAPDYDTLVDNPIDAGHPLVVTIRPAGIPHRISLCGGVGNYELERIEADLTKVVEATVRLVGESPLTSYTFFYHLTDIPDGGLEHAGSTSCVVRRLVFRPEEDYQHFLAETSHEYLHLYNVKRIRPKVLEPFDYTREAYTRLLWWMEGTTEYYAYLLLRRAGLLTPPKYLETLAKQARQYLDTPGRHHQSLEEASFLAWIDYYQPTEETPNRSVSYYLKGALVSFCLDLEIRHRSENRASLDTVLRALWQEYGKVGRGLDENGFVPLAERATGLDLQPFFARYVRGTDEIDFDAFARWAGLTFGPKPKDPDDSTDEPGYLGIRYENSGGLVRAREVLSGTPAREAGLTPGDEIVAFNGIKVTHEGFDKSLKHFPPGTPVDVTIFRRGHLRTLSIAMGRSPPEKYAFTPVEGPDELARTVYEGWLESKWEPAKKPGT